MSHLVPPSLGGTDALTNIIPSCLPCRERKGRLSLDAFRAREAQRTFPYFGTLRFWGEQQTDT
jgi:5-methylcytosine-specific restriction endonuclease McrA